MGCWGARFRCGRIGLDVRGLTARSWGVNPPAPMACPPPNTLPPMQNRRSESDRLAETEILASFGEAKIVKHLDGRLEIVGGTPEERDEVSVWMRQFLQPQGHLE